jgi:predicted nucleic acid-binding protein
MILVDTSVWVEHLRFGNAALVHLLESGQVLTHPFVIGELALGSLSQRAIILNALHGLPQTLVASAGEVLHLIEQHGLFGNGIAYVDVHMLAAVRLTPGSTLWTLDKRLLAAANKLGVSAGCCIDAKTAVKKFALNPL